MDIQSVNILKFKTGKVLLYPLRTIKDEGSFSIPPYVVKHDISFVEMAKYLKEILKFSGLGLNPPNGEESFYDKKNVKITGIKNSKMMHDESLHVGIFTKEGSYYISPSSNRGSRRGFVYGKENVSIPLDSSTELLAKSLEEAFEKSS